MIIYTENGPRSFYAPKSVTPKAVIEAERVWRDAWNKSATEFDLLVERTQSRYQRMMDVAPLKLIPDGEVKIPA